MPSLHDTPFGQLLDDIAAKTPAPGGGAVASAAGALAAALGGMVVSFSVGRRSLEEHQTELAAAGEQLRRQRDRLVDLAAKDVEAFDTLMAVLGRPKDDPSREVDLPPAVAGAILIPRTAMGVCADLMGLLERLATIGNERLRSDVAVAAVLCEAAGASAAWNVRANLPLVRQASERLAVEEQVDAEVGRLMQARARVEAGCLGPVLGR